MPVWIIMQDNWFFNTAAHNNKIPKKIWIYWEGEFPEFVHKCVNNVREKTVILRLIYSILKMYINIHKSI